MTVFYYESKIFMKVFDAYFIGKFLSSSVKIRVYLDWQIGNIGKK